MFYILTSHNIFALKKQFETLPQENTTVVINTLDKDYEKQAQDFCTAKKIRFFVTESDGTAATGKNSFLSRFEKDDEPYAVLIDGDDSLTARGVKFYQNRKKEGKIDALVLQNPISKTWKTTPTQKFLLEKNRKNIDPDSLPFKMTFGSTVADWRELRKGGLIEASYSTSEKKKVFQRYIELLHKGMGIDEIAARVVLMSRKCLEVPYRQFSVGEDTLQYLELKNLHDQKKLLLASHDEAKGPTYIYDSRLSGIAIFESQRNNGQGFLLWMEKLKNELEALDSKGRLKNTRILEWHMV